MPIAPGARLGPYEVLSPIGAGGMGEVYRARDPRLDRDVALKVLPAEHSRDPDRLRRFERETRALAALSHPNILALHDAGSADGVCYAIFELLEGESLRQKLDRGPLPVRKAVEWGAQVCAGLAAAHGRGIVHRDLKPDNLAFATDGAIKILDFGLARLNEPVDSRRRSSRPKHTATQTPLVLGTAGYMSPEQARGLPADARSDLFSVGAIVYEMLTGRRAFEGATSADRISATLFRDPPEMVTGPEPVPGELDRIVRRCLEKEPQDRFQTARDLAFALQSLSGSSPALALRTAVRPSRPRWVLAAAAGLLLIAAATGAFFWASHLARPVPALVPVAGLAADGNWLLLVRDGEVVSIQTTRLVLDGRAHAPSCAGCLQDLCFVGGRR
jgi:serine/threonine protein kinase